MSRLEITYKAFLPYNDKKDIDEVRKLPMHELMTLLYLEGQDMSRQIKREEVKNDSSREG